MNMFLEKFINKPSDLHWAPLWFWPKCVFPPNPIRSGPVRPDPMWSGKITMGLVTLAVLFWILVNWYAFTQSVNIAISIISIRCGTTDGMYSEYNSHRSRMNVAPLSGEWLVSLGMLSDTTNWLRPFITLEFVNILNELCTNVVYAYIGGYGTHTVYFLCLYSRPVRKLWIVHLFKNYKCLVSLWCHVYVSCAMCSTLFVGCFSYVIALFSWLSHSNVAFG